MTVFVKPEVEVTPSEFVYSIAIEVPAVCP